MAEAGNTRISPPFGAAEYVWGLRTCGVTLHHPVEASAQRLGLDSR